MELSVLVPDKQTTTNLTVSNSVFGEEFREPLIHQAVTTFLEGLRQGTKAQKTRGEVSGGGRKPWAQKHTGMARAGTIRSPIWRKGGVIFAAKPRDFTQKLPKKMYRLAIRSILSELVRQDRLIVVETFQIEQPKTRLMKEKLKAMNLQENLLIVIDALNSNVELATRNLPLVEVRTVQQLDPVALIKFDKVLITVGAIKQLEEWLS